MRRDADSGDSIRSYSCHPLSEQIYMQYPDVMDWHTGIVATASKHTHTRQRNA